MSRQLLLVSTLALFTACSEHTAPNEDANANVVAVQDNRFTPAQFTVAPGGTVTWDWTGSNLHNVTFDDGAASRTQADGRYQQQFTAPGTYPYTCTIHGPAMSGTVQVTAPQVIDLEPAAGAAW